MASASKIHSFLFCVWQNMLVSSVRFFKFVPVKGKDLYSFDPEIPAFAEMYPHTGESLSVFTQS